MWVIFVYVILSVVLAVSAWLHAGLTVGLAFVGGSVLAISAGGGLRASFLGPTKQKVWGSVIAAILLALGMWVGTHFSAQIEGVYISGPVWVAIGFVVVLFFVDKKMLTD